MFSKGSSFMNRVLLSALLIAICSPACGAGFVGIQDPTNPGNVACVDSSGNLCVKLNASGTQDVNVKQINGTTVLTGAGATGAGSERTTVAQDGTTIAGSAPGTAGTSSTNVITVQGIAGGTPVPVSGTVTANNASVSTTGTAVPGSATYSGMNVGGNLTGLTGTANGLKVDGSAVTQPVSGTVTTTPPANASTNVTQFGGNNVVTGTGAGGNGIPRVTISNDSSLAANQSVNEAQVSGTATSVNNGTTDAGTERVTLSSDSTGQVKLATGSNIAGKVGIDQTTDVTTNGVEIAPTAGSAAAPSNYVSGAAESGHAAVKSGAGNLYGLYCYSTAAGLCMVFNSTTVPADGAVTPIECVPVSANNFSAFDRTIPDQYATGISIAFSTGTNCFNKTASATAFFRVRYK
jgi:hypothetical protein